MSRTLIKVCGITTLEDALHAAGCGADALGFNFWPSSPRFVEPEAARGIIDALPPGVLRVGVFVDETAERIEAVARMAALDIAQVHGTPDRPPGRRWWQALSAADPALRATIEGSAAEAFLIDTPAGAQRGGTGRTFDWSAARGLPGRIVLAGGLGPDNAAEAIRIVRPWGVDACSRLERGPGRKDPRKVEEFILRVRETDEE